jgi:hypothetical protein
VKAAEQSAALNVIAGKKNDCVLKEKRKLPVLLGGVNVCSWKVK